MGLSARKRLRSSADFHKAMRRGRRVDGGSFALFARAGGAVTTRLGLAVGRRVGGAVVRNRIKRQLREAFRLSPSTGSGLDIVLIAKPAAAGRTTAALGAEFERQLRIARPRGTPS